MSLDVYLTIDSDHGEVTPVERIFIRENGQTREISRDEWEQRFPGIEPVTVTNPEARDEVYSANITHNLNRMAEAAGIYKHLWRPDELGITKASQLIEPLRAGLTTLVGDPQTFKKHNPSNGWGSYEGLVGFVRNYLAACECHPEAKVNVSR